MTRTIREYIKEHGRTAARMKFGDRIDDMPICIAGRKVGILKRYKHKGYQQWVWQASVVYKDVEYQYIDFDNQITALDWGYRKIEALENPQFGIMLREQIASSPLTVEQIADIANCSRYVIFKWMRSESYPSITHLQRITRAISPMGWPPLFDAWCSQIEMEQ
jgi:hypothetical protein